MNSKLIVFLILILVFTACKKETKKKTITFNNKLYTTVTITCNNETKNIHVGSSVTFDNLDGSPIPFTGHTSGLLNDTGQIGLKLKWDSQIDFTNDAMVVDLTSSKDFFFLKIQNTGQHILQDLYVNYGLQENTFDKISIQNDSEIYPIGYYKIHDSTCVRLSFVDNTNQTQFITKFYNTDFYLPETENQSVVLTFNPNAKRIIYETKSIAMTPRAIPQYAVAK